MPGGLRRTLHAGGVGVTGHMAHAGSSDAKAVRAGSIHLAAAGPGLHRLLALVIRTFEDCHNLAVLHTCQDIHT